jgi:hypothetical protein
LRQPLELLERFAGGRQRDDAVAAAVAIAQLAVDVGQGRGVVVDG